LDLVRGVGGAAIVADLVKIGRGVVGVVLSSGGILEVEVKLLLVLAIDRPRRWVGRFVGVDGG